MSSSEFPQGVAPFSERKFPDTIVLADVDLTLSLPRQLAKPEMLEAWQKLRKICATGVVGGSNLVKIEEQLKRPGTENMLGDYDFVFSENGLNAYRLGKPLDSASFIGHVGEEEWKKMSSWVLHYIADLDIPIKRGISPFLQLMGEANKVHVYRVPNGNGQHFSYWQECFERNDFEAYDKVRAAMIEKMRAQFPEAGLKYSIGGQISFDVFPEGWDKTYCLRHVEKDHFKTIHFFGDKTFQGGNDFEIYSDPRVTGHSVKNPDDTLRQINEIFFSS